MKNPHYKFLASKPALCENGILNNSLIIASQDEDIQHHFKLLQLDELSKAYLPYMEDGFRWTNAEKTYLLDELNKYDHIVLPNELKMMLNTYRQKAHT